MGQVSNNYVSKYSLLFLQISVSDQDSGNDGHITYTITNGNQNGLYEITQNGNLTVAGVLDRETTPNFVLTIEAVDNPTTGTSRKSKPINVAIALRDMNDNSPIFDQQQCLIYVSDDVEVFSKVTTIGATDMDEGANKQLEYSMAGDNADSTSYLEEYFTFSASNADIFVKKQLDLNVQNLTSKQISFSVIAKDNGAPSLNTSMSCQLVIQGENKYSPSLLHKDEVIVTIPSSGEAGDSVFKINATDQDFGPNGDLLFTIIGGNQDGVFAVSPIAGKITLTKKPTLPFYLIQVNVSDSGSVSKRKSITFEMQSYYEGKQLVGGQVNIGDKLTTPPITTALSKGDQITLPVYIQVGLTPLEAFDVTLKYPKSDLTFVSSSISDPASFSVTSLNITDGVRLIGRVALQKAPIGVVKIVEITFQALATIPSSNIQVSAKIRSIHDQYANYLPSSDAPTTSKCDKTVFGDVTQDCVFTIADYAHCHAYIRHKTDGFASPKSSKFASMSPAQISHLDGNKDKLITEDDCDYFFDVLTGDSAPLGEVFVRIPDHLDHQGTCVLSATVSLDKSVGEGVGETPIADVSSVFVVLTYTDVSFLKNSHLNSFPYKVISSFNVTSSYYGDVISMVRSGNTFQFQTSIEFLPTTLGLTVGTVSTNKITGQQTLTTLFRRPTKREDSSSTSLQNVDIGVSLTMKFSTGYTAQQSVSLKETTSRCKNPLKITTLKISFDNDYQKIVQGREISFKTWFISFFEERELTLFSREVSVTNVKVSEGSIIVEFDVQHLQADQSQLLSDLKTEIQDGTLAAKYNSTILVPKKTLIVDGKETLGDLRDEDTTWIYVVIIIVCCIVFILVVMVVCLAYLKHRKRNKVWTDRTDFEMSETKLNSFDNRLKMAHLDKRDKQDDVEDEESRLSTPTTEFELVALTPLEMVSDFVCVYLFYQYISLSSKQTKRVHYKVCKNDLMLHSFDLTSYYAYY